MRVPLANVYEILCADKQRKELQKEEITGGSDD